MVAYDIATGTLTLNHGQPQDTGASALVDVKLVLERLGTDQTRAGEWVNVLGYITSIPFTTSKRGEAIVCIQALLLWSAGPVDVQRYQASLKRIQRS